MSAAVAASQGGPAADHRPRALRRRHRAARGCSGRRSSARPRRTPRSSRSTPRPPPRGPGSTPSTPATTRCDLAAPLPMAWVPPGVDVNNPEHWALARGVVNHVGDPVAIVIGEDRYAVSDAVEDVVVEYDPLPVVVDAEAALEGGPLVHEALGTNKVHEWSLPGGDVEAGFDEADVIVRAQDRQPPDRRRADRDAGRTGRLPRRVADALDLDPGAALRAAVHGAAARADRGPRARDRARGRRRLSARSCRSTARS